MFESEQHICQCQFRIVIADEVWGIWAQWCISSWGNESSHSVFEVSSAQTRGLSPGKHTLLITFSHTVASLSFSFALFFISLPTIQSFCLSTSLYTGFPIHLWLCSYRFSFLILTHVISISDAIVHTTKKKNDLSSKKAPDLNASVVQLCKDFNLSSMFMHLFNQPIVWLQPMHMHTVIWKQIFFFLSHTTHFHSHNSV